MEEFRLNPERKENLTAEDLLKMRERVVNHYGVEILNKPKPSWTKDQEVGHILYQTLTKSLYEMVPDLRGIDQIGQLYARNKVDNAFELILRYITKIIWAALPILVFLALFKFIFGQ